MELGFLLMSGGLSSRMGRPKALLELGGETLLTRIARAGCGFEERILSVNDPAIPTPEGFARVSDVYIGCGPMGGLHAALSSARSGALVCAPCDAPLFTADVAAYLAAQFDEGLDALILEDDAGRVHPLMGVYAKSCLPALTKHLDDGRYKLMLLLSQLRVKRIRLPQSIPQSVFQNLNTPADLRAVSSPASDVV